jgi:hypothetical protein
MVRLFALLCACFLIPAQAAAQEAGGVDVDTKPVNNRKSGELPPPQDDNDPTPPAPSPVGEGSPGITKQAGIGGTQAYARAGVLELGGSIGLTGAEDIFQMRATPSIGWFLADNLQISLLTSLTYASQAVGDDDISTTTFGVVLEPSYHVPFNNTTFIFAGVGAGFSSTSMSGPAGTPDGPGAGFLVSPRLGMNFLVGRSGILSPYVHYDYSTVDSISTRDGALLAVSASYGANIGYTVMW